MALTANWRERSLVDASGQTGKVYYIRIIGREGYVWNPVTKLMVLHSAVTWATSAILLVEDGSTGVFPITISPDIPASTYDIIVYNRVGAIAVNTDPVEKQWQAKLGGDIFGF
ncbi:MAG: hypothetical protein IMZ47_07615 [Firmicutes bacterium]|nr:hypothetical protein [Bacillota bacterium]